MTQTQNVDSGRLVIVTSSGCDWGAIYVDGEVVDVGHPDDLYERALDRLGVRVVDVDRDTLMLGDDSRSVKPSLEDVDVDE